MSLKYVVVFGDDRIRGGVRVFPWLHVPIDNIVLEQLHERGAPSLKERWSRIAEYPVYFELLKWIRESFPSEEPLAVEFRIWKKGMEKTAEASA